MGDVGEDYKAYGNKMKELRENRNVKFEPILIEVGAKELSYGVWRIGDWDCYPFKGGARNFKTGKRIKLEKLLREKING